MISFVGYLAYITGKSMYVNTMISFVGYPASFQGNPCMLTLWFLLLDILHTLQGYPQKMKFQRRLYGIYSLHLIPSNCKLVSLLNHQKSSWKDHTQGRRLNLTLESSDLKSFRSSLQSLSLWVTLCIFIFWNYMFKNDFLSLWSN